MLESSKLSGRFDVRFWIVTLSALALIALTFALGLWQLERAAQKKALTQTRKAMQPVSISGRWLAEQTVYIDNRQMSDRVGTQAKPKQGFFVITPLVLANNEFVLVERGWIARDFIDRKKLHSIQTPEGVVTLSVRRLSDPVQPAVIADNVLSEYPIVQFVSLPAFAKAMPSMAYKGYVQQLGGASEGLQRNWYEPASGVDKHYGYAFQWFALCAMLAGLYVWFQWLRPSIKKSDSK